MRQLNRGEDVTAWCATCSMVNAALGQLRREGFPTHDEDVARLSPFIHERHINLLWRYSFAVPEVVTRGELRPYEILMSSTFDHVLRSIAP